MLRLEMEVGWLRISERLPVEEGSNSYGADLGGKRGLSDIYIYIYEKQVSGLKKKVFRHSLAKEWLTPNKAVSCLPWDVFKKEQRQSVKEYTKKTIIG